MPHLGNVSFSTSLILKCHQLLDTSVPSKKVTKYGGGGEIDGNYKMCSTNNKFRNDIKVFNNKDDQKGL